MRRVIFTVAAFMFVAAGCGASAGACLGVNGLFDNNYCSNDLDESECSVYSDEGVNGASWSFHSGRTCGDLGYELTS
jgi:hypothetical protein